MTIARSVYASTLNTVQQQIMKSYGSFRRERSGEGVRPCDGRFSINMDVQVTGRKYYERNKRKLIVRIPT